MYILDTNSMVYFFKGLGCVGERLLQTSPRNIGISAVVLYELEVGIVKSNAGVERRAQLEDFAASVEILPFGIAEARVTARVRADLEQAGTPIGPLDTLIAGTALRHGATLVTHNVKEFGRVRGLALEDWY